MLAPHRLFFWLRPLLWVAACLFWTLPSGVRADDGFLDPAQAFRLSARVLDPGRVELRFDIAPGYYLYRDKITVTARPESVTVGEVRLPPGAVQFDPYLEKEVATFRESVVGVVSVAPSASAFQLVVGNQGCADKGLCYPPTQRTLQVEAGAQGMTSISLTEAVSSSFGQQGGLLSRLTAGSPGPAPAATSGADDDRFTRALRGRSLPEVAGLFLVGGLLLAFTPCVLPMLPILSSVIIGQAGTAGASRRRGFSLALSYSLGMAIVYTAFGIAAALIGGGLGGTLQQPWVLGLFAVLLVVLSMSMFDVYELRLPSGLHNRLSAFSSGLQGGRYLGVFVMGALSALIVSPCIAAPLATVLVYISQTRDVGLGGLALFSLAAGMSVPLLLFGASAGAWLPRSGGWMRHVKHFFGLLLLCVALWMASPLMSAWVVMLLVALLMLTSAVHLRAFEPLPSGQVQLRRSVSKGFGLVLGVLAAALLIGAASGGRSLLRPLGHLGAQVTKVPALNYKAVTSLAALENEVRTATGPVMVEWYADWCIACKEFEALTLNRPAVRERLAGMTLLRVDLTVDTDEHRALLRHYSLFGPPAVLFFTPGGAELKEARVIGFQSESRFFERLAQVEATSSRPRAD